jgi:hypothetical protein
VVTKTDRGGAGFPGDVVPGGVAEVEVLTGGEPNAVQSEKASVLAGGRTKGRN